MQMSIFYIDEIKLTNEQLSIVVVEEFLRSEKRSPEKYKLDNDGNPFTMETAERFILQNIPKPWRILITCEPMASKAPNDSIPDWHSPTGTATRYALTEKEAADIWVRLRDSSYPNHCRTATDPDGILLTTRETKRRLEAAYSLIL
jgi:hypothetical protein